MANYLIPKNSKIPALGTITTFSKDGKIRMILPLREWNMLTFNFNGDYTKIPSLEDSVSLSKGYIFLKHDSKLHGLTYPISDVISSKIQ